MFSSYFLDKYAWLDTLTASLQTVGMLLDPKKWVSEHGTVMYRYVLARTGRPDVAENLVQEAFVGALKAQESFSGRSSERTWLMGILKHKLMDYYRRKHRELPAEELGELSDGVDELFERNGQWKVGPAPWGSLPEQAAERGQFRAVLAECLGHLPERQATVFALRELDGMETEEICKEMGVTETNLWVMMHRARARLRRCLEVNWFESSGGRP